MGFFSPSLFARGTVAPSPDGQSSPCTELSGPLFESTGARAIGVAYGKGSSWLSWLPLDLTGEVTNWRGDFASDHRGLSSPYPANDGPSWFFLNRGLHGLWKKGFGGPSVSSVVNRINPPYGVVDLSLPFSRLHPFDAKGTVYSLVPSRLQFNICNLDRQGGESRMRDNLP